MALADRLAPRGVFAGIGRSGKSAAGGTALLALALMLGRNALAQAQAHAPAPEPMPPQAEVALASPFASTRLQAGVGAAHYVSEEPLPDGRVFNREQGTLRRTTLELRLAEGAWAVTAALRQAHGTLAYRGQTQFGIPLYTQTDLSRCELALLAEHQWQPHEGGPTYTLGAGAEALRTVRDIRATPFTTPLTETLSARQWALGAAAVQDTALAGHPVRVTASAQLNRPFSQALAVDTHGVVDPLTLQPGKRRGGRLGWDMAMALGANVEIGLNLGARFYRPGASESATAYRGGMPVGSASYPGSVQTVRHCDLVLNWRL